MTDETETDFIDELDELIAAEDDPALVGAVITSGEKGIDVHLLVENISGAELVMLLNTIMECSSEYLDGDEDAEAIIGRIKRARGVLFESASVN